MTKTKTVERVYVDNGRRTVVDRRTVHVSVSQTQNLRSLQQINVTWRGAHVTQGVDPDPNSDLAQNEEYSFALFECRGVDSTKVPVKDRLSPSTCWTNFADERYQQSYSDAPAWQSDLFATPAQRQSVVGQPGALAPICKVLLLGVAEQRWVPFTGADGHSYPGGPDGCDGLAPEASPENLTNLSLPSNETFAVTGPDGTGRAKFDIFTGQDHASLGCSTTVKCSLVAIPIEGISCDPQGSALPAGQRPPAGEAADAKSNCETSGNFKPGQLLDNNAFSGAAAVDGTLWWSPSNWRNRIVFPLTFAQSDNVCSLFGNQTQLPLFGSELMQQAMLRWAPHFCLDGKLFNPKLVDSSEPQARDQLATNEASSVLSPNGVQAAVGADPPDPGFPEPTVQAPVAASGFGIAFSVDDPKQNQVLHLNLDARLLAKLLTESYSVNSAVKSEYPVTDGVQTLGNNPLNIAEDPEFQALNPGVGIHDSDAAAALLTLNINSDVMTQLTTYINNDPAARTFLNGQPDPWGMRVNPHYKGLQLPVQRWPVGLDNFEPTGIYKLGINDCLAQDPQPFLPLVQDPQSSLYQIALDADFAIAQPQTNCKLIDPNGSDAGAKLVAAGRQDPGYRFMLSVVSLPDAARFDEPLASLATSHVPATQKFTSAAGQTFVSPTVNSMSAALELASWSKNTGSFQIPSGALARSTTAYPGTMLLNADVPTTGLSKTIAGDYAKLLTYAAGPGQVAGTAAGDLPPGYAPISADAGLRKLSAYTRLAATAIAAQSGHVPTPGENAVSGNSPQNPGTPQAPSGGGTGSSGPSTSSGSGIGSTPGSGSTPTGSSVGPAGGAANGTGSEKPGGSSLSARQAASIGKSPVYTGGPQSWALPALLIVLLLGAGGVIGIHYLGGRR